MKRKKKLNSGGINLDRKRLLGSSESIADMQEQQRQRQKEEEEQTRIKNIQDSLNYGSEPNTRTKRRKSKGIH
jgi:hypothetical protein